jgi:hypothetical protein
LLIEVHAILRSGLVEPAEGVIQHLLGLPVDQRRSLQPAVSVLEIPRDPSRIGEITPATTSPGVPVIGNIRKAIVVARHISIHGRGQNTTAVVLNTIVLRNLQSRKSVIQVRFRAEKK